jgi:hypothetical protein
MEINVPHSYGGPWTELKLDVLKKYLNFYTDALKNQRFEKWYIDAFAGTGERHEITVREPDMLYPSVSGRLAGEERL